MSRKTWSILIVLSFFLPLFVFGYYSLLDGDGLFSPGENRTLAQKPEFLLSAWFDGSFSRDYNTYYNDQFPLRDIMLGANEGLTRLYGFPVAGGSTEAGGEFDMGQGQSLEDLFGTPVSTASPAPSHSPAPPPSPTPETEETPSPTPEPSPSPTPEPSPSPTPEPTPTPKPTEPPQISDDVSGGGYLLVGDAILHRCYTSSAKLQIYAEMLNRWQENFAGHTVISMVVPNSYPFYAPADKMSASLDQQAMIAALHELLNDNVVKVDSYTPIAAHSDEYLYYRTDHHWTARGAYWAYVGFCESMGYEPSDISTWESGSYEGFIGSFYAQVKHLAQAALAVANPDTVEYFIPPTAYNATAYRASSLFSGGWSIPVVNTTLSHEVSNKYMAFTNGDQALIHIETEVKNGRSILVIKESYGNALIPYLLAHYETIYVLDYRKFNRPDKGDPPLSLADLLEDIEAQDILLVSYPYVPNSSGSTDWLGRLG